MTPLRNIVIGQRVMTPTGRPMTTNRERAAGISRAGVRARTTHGRRTGSDKRCRTETRRTSQGVV
jgi:hypothetical protein